MRDRFGRQARHLRTREEERELAEARRTRRQDTRAPRDRAGDAEVGFEKMRRRERVLGRTSADRAPAPNTAQLAGTIVWLGRGRARVRCGEHERPAALAPDLARVQQTAVAVGDEVVLHERPDADPLVVSVSPRRSELARVDPDDPRRARVLAANVDVVVLVLAADRARTGLVDRLLAALAGSGAELAVCVNKQDLAHDQEALQRALAPHRDAGLAVVFASAVRGDGIDELRALLRGRAAAFVGHSGVGKSTLLNRLDPRNDRATGAVRDRDGRGRHTTSASSLTVLADGTRLIDTPGVRAFGLPEGRDDASAAFPDVHDLAQGCRFRDCAHRHEPGCAVRAAAEHGALDPARYRAFLRLGS